jgi:hypothetical protein
MVKKKMKENTKKNNGQKPNQNGERRFEVEQ